MRFNAPQSNQKSNKVRRTVWHPFSYFIVITTTSFKNQFNEIYLRLNYTGNFIFCQWLLQIFPHIFFVFFIYENYTKLLP